MIAGSTILSGSLVDSVFGDARDVPGLPPKFRRILSSALLSFASEAEAAKEELPGRFFFKGIFDKLIARALVESASFPIRER